MKVSTATSYSFIIEHLENYSVSYINVINHSTEIDKILYFPHYEKRASKHFPKFLREFQMDKEALVNEILNPLNEIYEEANKKRYQAYKVFSTDPFLPKWKIFYYYLFSKHTLIMRNLAEKYYNSFGLYITWAILYFFSLFFLSFFLILIMGLLICVDFLTCTLFTSCSRHSDREKQFLQKMFDVYPSLETPAIDKEIMDKFENLKTLIHENYPSFQEHHIIVAKKAKRVRRNNHWETMKQLIFKITIKQSTGSRSTSLSQDYEEYEEIVDPNSYDPETNTIRPSSHPVVREREIVLSQPSDYRIEFAGTYDVEDGHDGTQI